MVGVCCWTTVSVVSVVTGLRISLECAEKQFCMHTLAAISIIPLTGCLSLWYENSSRFLQNRLHANCNFFYLLMWDLAGQRPVFPLSFLLRSRELKLKFTSPLWLPKHILTTAVSSFKFLNSNDRCFLWISQSKWSHRGFFSVANKTTRNNHGTLKSIFGWSDLLFYLDVEVVEPQNPDLEYYLWCYKLTFHSIQQDVKVAN